MGPLDLKLYHNYSGTERGLSINDDKAACAELPNLQTDFGKDRYVTWNYTVQTPRAQTNSFQILKFHTYKSHTVNILISSHLSVMLLWRRCGRIQKMVGQY